MQSERGEHAAAAMRLGRLAAARAPAERDLHLGKEFGAAAKSIRGRRAAVGGVVNAWETVLREGGVAEQLIHKTFVVSVGRGVLTVRAPDAAAKYVLDRFI